MSNSPSVSLLDDPLLAKVVESYDTTHDPEIVVSYLRRHTELVKVLAMARGVISRYFGGDVSVALDVVTDPEQPNEPRLFALIQTSLDPGAALPLMDAFNDDWWRDASVPVDADLNFGVDYV